MAKLELDSYMDEAELASTIQEAMARNNHNNSSISAAFSCSIDNQQICAFEQQPQQQQLSPPPSSSPQPYDTTTTTTSSSYYYESLYLNCIDLDLTTTTAVTNLIVSQSWWESIELEECTGHLEQLLAIVMNHAAAGKVEKLKIVGLGSNRLEEASLFALVVGLQRCRTKTTTTMSGGGKYTGLRELRLSLTLTREDAVLLAKGLDCRNNNSNSSNNNNEDGENIMPKKDMSNGSVSTLQTFCLWDCTLEPSALEILAQEGLRYNTSLQEFGLVACTFTTTSSSTIHNVGDEDSSSSTHNGPMTGSGNGIGNDDEDEDDTSWLATLVESLYHHPALERLDLRCLATSDIAPIARFLEQPNCNLKSLDLSFKSGGGNEPMDLGLLTTAFRNRRNAQGQRCTTTLQRLHLSGLLLTDEDVEAVMETCVEASSSLDTLTLSLNKITDEGILQCVARRIANNGCTTTNNRDSSNSNKNHIRLKRLYLDGNPFHEEGSLALLDAMKTNVDLEELRIPPVMEECQRELDYYARLNRGGRRLVAGDMVLCSDEVSSGTEDGHHANRKDDDVQTNQQLPQQQLRQEHYIPLALWSLVLARANQLDFEQRNNYPNRPGRADVLYYLLRNGPILFPV